IGKEPLAKIMQGLQQCFTQYFNRKYNRTGHVFQQRYKAQLCTSDRYLITLVAYIHQNPVRAGMPQGLEDPWSSHHAYVTGDHSLVNIDFILDMFHSDRREALVQYLELMNSPQAMPELVEIGSSEEAQPRKKDTTEDPQCGVTATSWEAIIDAVIAEACVDRGKLLGSCRERKVVAARNRLIQEAVRREVMTRSELAKRLGVDVSRITRVLQQAEE
ncbi:hypothetical protein, partial [Acetonema longum]